MNDSVDAEPNISSKGGENEEMDAAVSFDGML